jgi:hypothetical protein
LPARGLPGAAEQLAGILGWDERGREITDSEQLRKRQRALGDDDNSLLMFILFVGLAGMNPLTSPEWRTAGGC